VFADVDPVTLTLAPDRAEAAITGRTRALIAVHLYGLPAAMDALRAVAEARGLALIEDAAQAFGATWRERPAGGLGTVAGFSFYPTKNLGACGDAGLVTARDGEVAARVRSLRNHGQAQKYEHADAGWTSRLDELQAAILRVKLAHLGAWTAARQRVAARYDAGLAPLPVTRPPALREARHIFHQYTIRTRRRDALAKHLAAAGIGTAVHYPAPIPAQPLFRALGYAAGDFPCAWAASREVLSLPCFPELTDGEVDAVLDAIRTFFEGEPPCGS
jgi:dTDP-4-amino-4,6-dideoxygalactose transaminase